MFKDRVAIVTGSSSGIGKAIALHLAKLGARVVITSNESIRIPQTLEEVQEFSPDSVSFEADVTSPPCLAELTKFAVTDLGRIDILVNNAGITRDNLLMRMKEHEWDSVIATNLKSAFLLCKQVVRPMMKKRYGRIINIASVVGATGNAGQVNYTAAKAGLVAFTKSLALEVASRGITANCVSPGFIATRMTDELNDEARNAILSKIPLGKMGSVEDICHAVTFLASEQAGYITGENLHVNGGMYMP